MELKEKDGWVPLTPAQSIPPRCEIKSTDNRPHEETVEAKSSNEPKIRTPKKRVPVKRLRMKRHRPKVYDEMKAVKPLTPKPQTPKRAKHTTKDNARAKRAKKDSPKTIVDPSKETVVEPSKEFDKELGDYNTNSCRKKLDFDSESKPNLEPKNLLVYRRRIFKCLKNSRKLGPNWTLFKKARMIRQRATEFAKFIGMFSIIPATKKQRKAIMNGYPKLNQALSRKQNPVRTCVSGKKITEDVEHPTPMKFTWSSKKKRSNISTRRRDLSSFVDDISKIELSETFLLKASTIRTRDRDRDEVLHMEMNESPQCPEMVGVEMDVPEHNSKTDILPESDLKIPYVGPSNEQENENETSSKQENENENVSTSQDCMPKANGFISEDAFMEALVDFVSQSIKGLHIDDKFNQLVVRDSLFNSKEKLDPSKKPKVDLDPETIRVWNLLMEKESGKNGNEDIEKEDDEKAKYWKKERELFEGRLDELIACLHLIQGDKRFSPWKGSVVDSVVGVFLTQNVSDHLSSNAFMSLAAKYPPPSVNGHNQLKIVEPLSGECDQMEKVQIAEPSFRECDQLLPMEKAQIGVDPVDVNKISSPGRKKGKLKDKQEITNWDELRVKHSQGTSKDRTDRTKDSVNWEAVRQTSVRELAKVILERGMNNLLAQRIKDFLDRLVRDHGSIDLEWLRDVPPDKAKEYLLSISGLGLKSVECVRLLTLHHRAFPVDVNISRVLVRYGWVPLQTLPEDVLIHLLNDANRLPNGSRGENTATKSSVSSGQNSIMNTTPSMLFNVDGDFPKAKNNSGDCEPIIEFPASPMHESTEIVDACAQTLDIEDLGSGSEDEMPTIELNDKELIKTLLSWMDREDDLSKALVALGPEVAEHYRPKLKHVERLRTEHHV
ncbi:hypothetical protein DH2020_042920 [Rehmannia glutinosa]|uniref:HhH-GPD domain-containing protein n=1 Tax=Rehmannia glutinosa TaxID=99300 RepID=A0ABR0UL37_REHGL